MWREALATREWRHRLTMKLALAMIKSGALIETVWIRTMAASGAPIVPWREVEHPTSPRTPYLLSSRPLTTEGTLRQQTSSKGSRQTLSRILQIGLVSAVTLYRRINLSKLATLWPRQLHRVASSSPRQEVLSEMTFHYCLYVWLIFSLIEVLNFNIDSQTKKYLHFYTELIKKQLY